MKVPSGFSGKTYLSPRKVLENSQLLFVVLKEGFLDTMVQRKTRVRVMTHWKGFVLHGYDEKCEILRKLQSLMDEQKRLLSVLYLCSG